jgi:hypothetical protein
MKNNKKSFKFVIPPCFPLKKSKVLIKTSNLNNNNNNHKIDNFENNSKIQNKENLDVIHKKLDNCKSLINQINNQNQQLNEINNILINYIFSSNLINQQQIQNTNFDKREEKNIQNEDNDLLPMEDDLKNNKNFEDEFSKKDKSDEFIQNFFGIEDENEIDFLINQN